MISNFYSCVLICHFHRFSLIESVAKIIITLQLRSYFNFHQLHLNLIVDSYSGLLLRREQTARWVFFTRSKNLESGSKVTVP